MKVISSIPAQTGSRVGTAVVELTRDELLVIRSRLGSEEPTWMPRQHFIDLRSGLGEAYDRTEEDIEEELEDDE